MGRDLIAAVVAGTWPPSAVSVLAVLDGVDANSIAAFLGEADAEVADAEPFLALLALGERKGDRRNNRGSERIVSK